MSVTPLREWRCLAAGQVSGLQLMRHAVETGWRTYDPTREVRRLRTASKGYPTWSESDIAMFEQRWPLGTRANLAMRLLLYTGQCRGDVIKMGRQHVRNGVIEVLRAKTGARLAIPVHRQLQEALATLPTFDMTFLMTDFGRPFASGAAFYQWFIWCCRQAVWRPGFRHTGCARHSLAAWPKPDARLTRSPPSRGTRPWRR